MTVVTSTDSENVILMLGCRPDPSSKGSVSDSVGATDPFIVLSVTLSLLIVVFDIVELSNVELSIVALSIIEFVIVQLLNVELEIVELSILHETILEHCLTVELSMYELLVIDELSETVEELLIVELSNV